MAFQMIPPRLSSSPPPLDSLPPVSCPGVDEDDEFDHFSSHNASFDITGEWSGRKNWILFIYLFFYFCIINRKEIMLVSSPDVNILTCQISGYSPARLD